MKKELINFLEEDMKKISELVKYLRDLSPRPSWKKDNYMMAVDSLEDLSIYWEGIAQRELKQLQTN